ncbi:MAG: NAD-dependent epimerase/dehydratase family protein [Gammaproteobacteria bacterium]|nr:NAD-dependent epimerase/dehydratase family protein [Gammaproteobacteria bacterium]
MAVLVTGATGFVGRTLVRRLLSGPVVPIRALVRRDSTGLSAGCELAAGDLEDPASLRTVCRGVVTVFHCAGYAHAGRADSGVEADRHWRVNALGTRNLAEAAGQAGVSRFVFLSSVKAVGDPGENCVDESWDAPPTTPYGRAKRQAEQWLQEAGERYGMQAVILRPAMVYGPGGGGNLPRLIEAIRRGRFPPLPRVHNRRSMVHVEDLVQAAVLAAERAEAAGRTYLVTDGVDYSTGDLYAGIRSALGLRPAHRQFPPVLLRLAARAGDLLRAARLPTPVDSDAVERLLGSECYRSDRIRAELGYRPTHTLPEALPAIVASLYSPNAA